MPDRGPTLDPNNLSARAAARVINAAWPGTISRQQIQRHLQSAKFNLRGGKGGLHLLYYVAWLRRLLKDGQRLRRERDPRSQSQRMRERDRAARDIGPIPALKNPARRKSCRVDLPRFLKTFMPESFPLPWSGDHLHVLARTQSALLEGGLFAEAVYRGFGKSTLAVGAAIWCACYGHKKYIPIVSADKKAAEDIISDIQAEFEENDLLLQDFPGACWPMRCLEGISHRCRGQMSAGRRTQVEIKTDTLVLPTVAEADGSPAVSSGVILRAFGFGGRIRGLRHRRKDGTVVRPDCAILDDPQTDDSARSPSQCDTRERVITAAILGLSGHRRAMSAVMPCTVIRKGDLIDRFLDPARHPEWQGARLPMVKAWPTGHEEFWIRRYAVLRKAQLTDVQGGQQEAHRRATALYAANRAAMDAGGAVSWPECVGPGELSALQHAYNLLIDRGDRVFLAEYQLEPMDEFESIEPPLEPGEIVRKLNGLDRFQVEHGAGAVVAFVDLGKVTHIHWDTCWFADGFSGGLLDRGVRPLARTVRGGVEAAIYARLTEVTEHICGRRYQVPGGGELRCSLCVVDSGWQSRTVYAFCRQSPHAAVLAPSKGIGGEVELRPPRLCPKRDQGDGWYRAWTRSREARILYYNTDRWKTFTNERLRTGLGGRGCFSLWGKRPEEHRDFADQITAERPRSKQTKWGDVIAKWECLPGRENHYWDCLVGCHVGVATLGVALDKEIGGGVGPEDKPLRLSELQKQKAKGG
jgi:hypothetical protein